MAFQPAYGETVVSDEEAEALTAAAREILGDPIRKADLYDLEQQIQDEVADEWWATLLDGDVPVRDLLADHFVRDLHRRLYAPVWEWGGRQRSLETNIGVAPENIAAEMRNALDDLSYRWEHQIGIDARMLGMAAHAALVRIHPFVDGNGRVTRLVADPGVPRCAGGLGGAAAGVRLGSRSRELYPPASRVRRDPGREDVGGVLSGCRDRGADDRVVRIVEDVMDRALPGDLMADIDDHVFDIAPLLEWAERDEAAGQGTPEEPEP